MVAINMNSMQLIIKAIILHEINILYGIILCIIPKCENIDHINFSTISFRQQQIPFTINAALRSTFSILISSPSLHWRPQITGRYECRPPVTHFKRVIVPITDGFQGARAYMAQFMKYNWVPNCRVNAIKGI